LFIFAARSLQFAKAGSAEPLSQQKKNNSVNVQRDGFICTVPS
jgi:hypothetical protein